MKRWRRYKVEVGTPYLLGLDREITSVHWFFLRRSAESFTHQVNVMGMGYALALITEVKP